MRRRGSNLSFADASAITPVGNGTFTATQSCRSFVHHTGGVLRESPDRWPVSPVLPGRPAHGMQENDPAGLRRAGRIVGALGLGYPRRRSSSKPVSLRAVTKTLSCQSVLPCGLE